MWQNRDLGLDSGLNFPEIQKRFESTIDDQILNNDLAVVSSVYEPLLQPGVLSLHSSQS